MSEIILNELDVIVNETRKFCEICQEFIDSDDDAGSCEVCYDCFFHEWCLTSNEEYTRDCYGSFYCFACCLSNILLCALTDNLEEKNDIEYVFDEFTNKVLMGEIYMHPKAIDEDSRKILYTFDISDELKTKLIVFFQKLDELKK